MLAGYLRLPRGSEDYEYETGAFTDGEELIRHLSEDLHGWWVARKSISAGYFSPTLLNLISLAEAQKMAAWFVQPKILEKLSSHPTSEQFAVWYLDDTPIITSELVRRAREMIPVILARYPEQISYLTELKVICGLPIVPEEIDRLANVEHIKIEMKMVAHPQCPVSNVPFPFKDSMVCYDPVQYVNLNGLDNLRNLQFLYITGGLPRILPKRIQEVISHFHRAISNLRHTTETKPTM